MQGRYDLLVSRRGPTSFLNHLPVFAAPRAEVLCIYPSEEVRTKVLQQLENAGAEVLGEWTFRTRGHLPTLNDLVLYQRWNGDERSAEQLQDLWDPRASDQGYPIIEERYMFHARMP
ncbi:hypothetical protein GCM10008938_05990 [Deinococcus roseus]|uniref:Uncharacterized protein n=1 Tax=Deinococcus roseus TaxID=392414 RepID=A0ABQ2CUP7_9DEIO|nr:hypothetical protein GCM10008938_05990 [Deinococcus roseus]